MDASFFKEALKNYESTKENKGKERQIKIRTFNNEEMRQVILDAETWETIDDIDWKKLIGAIIVDIKEDFESEPCIIFTLSLKEGE